MNAKTANLYEVRNALVCVRVVADSIDEAIAKSAVVRRDKTEQLLRALNPDSAIVASYRSIREVKLLFSEVIL